MSKIIHEADKLLNQSIASRKCWLICLRASKTKSKMTILKCKQVLVSLIAISFFFLTKAQSYFLFFGAWAGLAKQRYQILVDLQHFSS